METLMSEALQTFNHPTCETTPNVTSSQELADGAMLCNLPDGLKTDPFGQEAVHASPSQPPESNSETKTNATSGLCSSISSASAALSSSLGSRLQTRLARVGSMEYRQTWKEQVTPAGRRYWAHTASAHPISDSDFTGWPTPQAFDASNDGQPRPLRYKGDAPSEAGHFRDPTKPGSYRGDLKDYAALAGWPTPVANDTTGSTHCYGPRQEDGARAHFLKLPGAAKMAGWATPAARDHKDTGNLEASRFRKDGKERNDTLARQVPLGLPSTSSPAQTEKRGALNPALPRWLMGFPPAWCDCAVMAMQLFLSVRKSSSKRS